MPGDKTLSFATALLEELWDLRIDFSVEARTSKVRSEVAKLASPFAMKHVG